MSLNLEAIKAYCAKATPGDWWWDSYNTVFFGVGESAKIIAAIPDHPTDDEWTDDPRNEKKSAWYKESAANAQLIANARQDLPACVEEIERLRAELAQWKERG